MQTERISQAPEIGKSLPKCVADVLRKLPGKVWLAGGAVRAKMATIPEPVRDYDLFCDSMETARAAVKVLVPKVLETDNGFTIVGTPVPVQVVTRQFYKKVEEVFASFDFTVCQAAVWWVGGSSGYWTGSRTREFGWHIQDKRLRYTAPVGNNAAGSLSRVLKYTRIGYTVDPDSIAAILDEMFPPANPHTTEGRRERVEEIAQRLVQCWGSDPAEIVAVDETNPRHPARNTPDAELPSFDPENF